MPIAAPRARSSAAHAASRPLQVAVLTQPYPDGFVLAQCLHVLCGTPVSCHSQPHTLLQCLQGPAAALTDLVLCDDSACGNDTQGVCLALSRLGLGRRLVLLADAHRRSDPALQDAMSTGMRWLLRPWTVNDLHRLLSGLRSPA